MIEIINLFNLILSISLVSTITIKFNNDDEPLRKELSKTYLSVKEYLPSSPSVTHEKHRLECSSNIIEGNSLLASLLLSTSLGLHPKTPGYNHPEHPPLNPYLALLLSHYGKYAPIHGKGQGIYGYNAVNNYHNNKPFGAYKIYTDNDR